MEIAMNNFWRDAFRSVCVLSALCAVLGMAQAADDGADAFIKRVSTDILDTIKTDKSIRNGDVQKIGALVDQRVMPHVNFRAHDGLCCGAGLASGDA